MPGIFFSLLERLLPSWVYQKLVGNWGQQGVAKYAANTLWLFAARIFLLGVSFVVSIYVIRYLGPHNYGLLSYAVSFVGIFSFIAGLGIDQVLYRDLVNTPEREKEILGSAFAIKFFSGLATTAVVILAASFLPLQDVDILLIAIIAFSFVFNSWNVIIYAYQARVRSKYQAFVLILVAIALAIAKLAVIYFGKGIIYFAAVALFDAALSAALYVAFYTFHFGSIFEWRVRRDIVWSMLAASVPLMFSAAFIMLYSRVDQIMIRHYIDPTSVGLYDVAVRLSEVWYVVPMTLIASLFPAILNAKKTSEEMYAKRLQHLAGLLIAVTTIIALPISIFSAVIISILYGSAYADSAFVLSVYVWSSLFAVLGTLIQYYLVAEHNTRLLFIISFGTFVLNIGLNVLLIPLLGILGAAVATLISYALMILIPLTHRRTRLRFIPGTQDA